MSTFYKGYKFQIYPTEEQAKIIDNYFNLNRYVYNWALKIEEKIYEEYLAGNSDKRFYGFKDLCKLFTLHRKEPDKDWLRELPVGTARGAIRNVVHAFENFFNKISGYPKLKKKNKCKKSFNTRSERFYIRNNKLRIEGLPLRDYIDLKFDCWLYINKVVDATVIKDNIGNYYACFNLVEESKSLDIPKSEGIGIDLGVRQTIVLSDGTVYNQPKEKLAKLQNKRNKIQRHVTRDINRRLEESKRTKTKYADIPKSKRAIKRENRLHRYDKKIHNVKNTFYHTVTKKIVDRNPEYVCMETFSVNHIGHKYPYMFKYFAQTSFFDIAYKMQYKCKNRSIPFIQAPMTFPSTKTCSNCGSIKNMKGKHTYRCPVCGMVEDRDINAAKNLKQYGLDALYSNIGKIE